MSPHMRNIPGGTCGLWFLGMHEQRLLSSGRFVFPNCLNVVLWIILRWCILSWSRFLLFISRHQASCGVIVKPVAQWSCLLGCRRWNSNIRANYQQPPINQRQSPPIVLRRQPWTHQTKDNNLLSYCFVIQQIRRVLIKPEKSVNNIRSEILWRASWSPTHAVKTAVGYLQSTSGTRSRFHPETQKLAGPSGRERACV